MKVHTVYGGATELVLRVHFHQPHGITIPSQMWTDEQAAEHIANVLMREGTGVFQVERMVKSSEHTYLTSEDEEF